MRDVHEIITFLNRGRFPNTYALDQTGRVTQVSTTLNGNPKILASSVSYLPYGGITGLTYGNTLSLSHGYDNQYRTGSITVGSTMNRTYTYDANGNVASFVDTEPLASDENAGAYSYQQATNKLTQVQGELNVVYGYDSNGNITSANNRTFTYDLSNRLITVQEGSTTLGQYAYSALNQRIKKAVQGQTTIFHYDLRGHLIAETTSSGQTLVEYFYLGDQPLAMIRPGEALYYYHNDHLGTPQILTNDGGTVSWKVVYGPFGEADIRIGAVENNIRFPGQYYDQETGLHYNWNRYYDPKTGRYLTPDLIGLEGGINLFVYTNNPVNWMDPFGLAVYYCIDGIHHYICLNSDCVGLIPASNCSGGGIIAREVFDSSHCKEMSIKEGKMGECCDQGKYENCVKEKAVSPIGQCHYYGFITYNCVSWARETIITCQKEACKNEK